MNYDRRKTALKVNPLKLWMALEEFLYPSWYKGSGYRGDLEPGPDLFLIEDFYQKYAPDAPIPDDIDPEFVARSFSRVREKTERAWERKREDVVESLQDLFGSSSFTAKDYNSNHLGLASSDLPRLVEEGILSKAGYSDFVLTPRYRR
jgi:hypothetical protein